MVVFAPLVIWSAPKSEKVSRVSNNFTLCCNCINSPCPRILKITWMASNHVSLLHVAPFFLSFLPVEPIENFADFQRVERSDSKCSSPISLPVNRNFTLFGRIYRNLSVCTDGVIALDLLGFKGFYETQIFELRKNTIIQFSQTGLRR